MKHINIIFTLFVITFLSIGFTGCEDEDRYTKEPDLFQPRFVLTEASEETNSLTLVWYEVKDADSYTIELHLDNYYKSLFASYSTDEPYLFLDDIPYSTRYYIRVKSVSKDTLNNSQWARTDLLTIDRPAYQSILHKITRSEVTPTTATVRWDVDVDNPVDSISLVPAGSGVVANPVNRFLTQEEKNQGFAVVTGLTENVLYNVNVCDNNKPRKYDKPYNKVVFRTAANSEPDVVHVHRGDDLSAILNDANEDPLVPEGVVYVLPAGSHYVVSVFQIQKGFHLRGETGGIKPQIQLSSAWNIADEGYIASLQFENITFYQIVEAQYFMNSGNSWDMEEVAFYNCDFKKLNRGFWRHQGNNKYKRIGSIKLDNCLFDQCGGHSGSYGTFVMGSKGADNIEKAVITNCTFMRDMNNMKNLFDHSGSSYPIHLEYQNITLYNYAVNRQLVNISSAEGSTFIFKNVLIASACGLIYKIAANTTTSFANNYATTDYLVGPADINGIKLTIGANDLFMNPSAGDLTIKDPTSPIAVNRVGDPRWLP